MKAAVMRAVGQPLQIEEIRIDAPGPREVVVRTAAGIVQVFAQNLDAGGRVPAPGTTVVLSWAPESTFVVDRNGIESEEDHMLLEKSSDQALVAMGELYDWLGYVQETLVHAID